MQASPQVILVPVGPRVRPSYLGADVWLTMKLPVPFAGAHFTEARPHGGRAGNS
jgi:hypothetical protein